MARAKAPFLSLGASGQFGKTVTAAPWKAIKTIRAYAKPSNPQTAAQTVGRDAMAAAVYAFRNLLVLPVNRTAFNLAATASRKPMSGYNFILSPLRTVLETDPDASFAILASADPNKNVEFAMRNMDDGAAADEAGDFAIWSGSSATSLLYLGAKTLAASSLFTDPLGDTGDVVYVQVRKGGLPRSGIYKITLGYTIPFLAANTGVADPDPSGPYALFGYHNGTFAYSLYPSGPWLIWWSNALSKYVCSQTLDVATTAWVKAAPNVKGSPAGVYEDYDTVTGDFTLSAV